MFIPESRVVINEDKNIFLLFFTYFLLFFRQQLDGMEEHLKTYGSEYPLKNYEK